MQWKVQWGGHCWCLLAVPPPALDRSPRAAGQLCWAPGNSSAQDILTHLCPKTKSSMAWEEKGIQRTRQPLPSALLTLQLLCPPIFHWPGIAQGREAGIWDLPCAQHVSPNSPWHSNTWLSTEDCGWFVAPGLPCKSQLPKPTPTKAPRAAQAGAVPQL